MPRARNKRMSNASEEKAVFMKKYSKWLSLGMALAMIFGVMGCGNQTPAGEEGSSQEGSMTEQSQVEEKEPFVPERVGLFEAEDGTFAGNVKEANSKSNYTGSGYVEGFEQDGDSVTVIIEVAEEGIYDLNFLTAASGGEKHNYVSVDGESIGTIGSTSSRFADSYLTRVYLTAGTHEVTVSKYWGYIQLDRVEVWTAEPIDPAMYEITTPLVNPNASPNAVLVFDYLKEIYGKQILSGQNCDGGFAGKEFQVIRKTTGKLPAVLGLDMMNYSPTNVKNGTTGNSVELAKAFWEKGGIVTMCWHWTVPEKYLTGTWYSSFYKEHTNIKLDKIMNGEDPEGYDLLMADIDAIAEALKPLAEADVPVLWRPLHEASGGWFWWGTSGGEACKKLWIAMYDKMVNEHGLNNLIWFWNGQDAEWYPGDEYVDIIGEDLYPGEKVYTSQAAKYFEAAAYPEEQTKMVYMSENGCIFDPDLAIRDGAMWGMWCTWGGEFVAKDTAIYTLSEQYTEEEMLIKAYSHDAVITLDELPFNK